MLKSDPPIIIEQELSASAAEIWAALTEIDEMRKWYFEILPNFKARVGFETNFTLNNEGRSFSHIWKVTEVIHQKKIAVQWSFDGYPGISIVEFDIVTKEDNNLVKLTAYATQDHPQDIPEFRRESGVGGWEYFINDRLKNYFESAK